MVALDINVRNLPTQLFAQWGITTNYGSATGLLAENFDYLVRRNITLSNLAPGTVYQLRVAATNSGGAIYGSNLTFKTLAPATVVTLPASARKTNSATLNASAGINGLATTAYFEWGTTTNYGQFTALQNLGSPVATTNVSAPLTGLAVQTAYHYRAVVYSSGLTNYGGDIAFSTTPPPTNLVVTSLLTDDVLGAIEQGGFVVFACDGVLTLSNQLEVANDVILDASGHAITLSGNDVTRLFKVLPGTTLTMTNLTLARGRTTNVGGAINNEGTVLAESCRFISNSVAALNGGVGTNGTEGSLVSNPNGQPGGPGLPGGSVEGGAVINFGSITFWRCWFVTDSAVGGNGGAGGKGGSAANGFSTGGSGGNGESGGFARGGSIANYGSLLLDGCSFSNSITRGGTGGNGGWGGSGLNSANGRAGTPGTAHGGAISTAGSITISNSLFVGSSCSAGNAGFPGSAPWSRNGSSTNGAVALGGAIYIGSNGLIANCTLLTNVARGGTSVSQGGNAIGGGIASAGFLQAVNLTLQHNSAIGARTNFGYNGNSLGDSIANTGGVFQIVNSLLSGGISNNAYGPITDLGHNLSSDATPAWTSGTSLNNTDPLLLPLANNGGPTLTMALATGSPALSNADPAASPATDQRGTSRPRGAGFDIGAWEGPDTPAISILPGNGTTTTLRWPAVGGVWYRVDASSDLLNWAPFTTNTPGADGWLEIPVPPVPSPRYFRLFTP